MGDCGSCGEKCKCAKCGSSPFEYKDLEIKSLEEKLKARERETLDVVARLEAERDDMLEKGYGYNYSKSQEKLLTLEAERDELKEHRQGYADSYFKTKEKLHALEIERGKYKQLLLEFFLYQLKEEETDVNGLLEKLKACEVERDEQVRTNFEVINRKVEVDKKLKAVEAERDGYRESVDKLCVKDVAQKEKLHALEKIAREGFDRFSNEDNILDYHGAYKGDNVAKEVLKKIDELMKGKK